MCSQQGCTQFLAGIGAVTGVYQTIAGVTHDTSEVVSESCVDWRRRRASVAAKIAVASPGQVQEASGIATWIDATCSPDAPPPKDPIAAAIWMAGLVARVDATLGP